MLRKYVRAISSVVKNNDEPDTRSDGGVDPDQQQSLPSLKEVLHFNRLRGFPPSSTPSLFR
jgi:hypothetical protein